ncbi:MAG: hypothetical protein WA211_01515 [Candidatus Acidiferrales bacterium]
MFAPVHFASIVAWLLIGIVALLWVMACGVAAGKMEKEGISFWRGFLTCLLLSPLVGLLTILIARMIRPSRRLAETVSRS